MGHGFRRVLLVSLGAAAALAGVLVMLVPVPLPPFGITLILGGATLLVGHSRKARRGMQRARHRSALLSRTVDRFAERAPGYFRRTLRRTRPDAIARHMQIAALGAVSRAD
ncbi:MAG TPA: hypothetical protein VN932_08850 [Rhizomicrobium sp.]|nr:hypothetical protein [Rhizomicrobium sp.]